MSEKGSLCNFLEWDSAFFGYRIGNVQSERLDSNDLQNILQWCSDNKIDCLYFLADSAHSETINLVEKKGFHFVDIRLVFEKTGVAFKDIDVESSNFVRVATTNDVTQLKAIATVNHRDSRFYYDGHFSPEKCDELFALWIEKSCKGYADAVFVAERNGKVEGYITCLLNQQRKGSIGLVGVSQQSQGNGVGKTLVNCALRWFSENNASGVSVVTQGRNIKAQRLYQKNGFVTESLNLWYHFWSK